jgi:hypothetical protein
LERRAERIAAPGDAGNPEAGLAEERVVDGDQEGCGGRQFCEDGATNGIEEGGDGKAALAEDPIIGGPVLKLAAASGEQAGDGVAAEAKQAAQGEGLRAVGEALLGEGRGTVSPELAEGGEDAGRVFFKADGGGWRRRRASRLLSSTDHSTVSPRENSMA